MASVADAADRQTEMKAREAFAAGRFSEALDLFAKLYAETLHPVYLRNIGRCHQKMREPQKAIDAFHDYLAKTKKIAPEERKEIEGYISEMEALRDEQARAEKPPVEPVPAATAHPTEPVAPSLAAPPPATTPAATLATPPSGTTSEPTTDDHPVYTRWWFWTIVGAVVVGGVATALVLSSGSSRGPCVDMTGMPLAGGCQ